MSEEAAPSWRPTRAMVRAIVVGYGALTAGVLLGRPDVLLLGAPLVVLALAATTGRPARQPVVDLVAESLTVHEGEEVTWAGTVSDVPRGGAVASYQPGQRWLDVEPEDGALAGVRTDGPTPVTASVRPLRWGRRVLGGPAIAAYDPWLCWRWGPVTAEGLRLTVLPMTSPLEVTAPAPHPRGLVGMERAARTGEGAEFAEVRPFSAGDRVRRIHWPVSARTGTLHVRASYADEDTHVALLVDAVNDVGETGGLSLDGTPGPQSSMDLTVRAAAILAEHFLHRGDRVGLRVFGAWGVSMAPAASGRLQLRRILDTLALIEPGTARGSDALAARRGLGAGTLAVMLSPLIDPAATQQVAFLHRRGIDVVVVDTLPAHLTVGSGATAADLAWRLRMLQRRVEMKRLAALGVPFVPWSGAHSLDQVLRDLTRRAAIPRIVAR